MAEAKASRVALLVDLENVKELDLQRLFEVAASEGQVIVRRVFGNFELVASRKEQVQALAFDQSALFVNTGQGKNGADIFLAIEAMDMLHRNVVDVFVIATKDSDYAKLGRRLREGGKRVVGIGPGEPAKVLVQSCDRYEVVAPAPAATAPGGAGTGKPKSKPTVDVREQLPDDLRVLAWTAIQGALPENGKVDGGKLHDAILRLDPAFDYGRYAKSFRDFLSKNFPEVLLSVNENGTMFVQRRAGK